MIDQVFDNMIADHLDQQDTIIGDCEMCDRQGVELFELEIKIEPMDLIKYKWVCTDWTKCGAIELENLEKEKEPCLW